MQGDHARSALAGTRFADVRWVAETGSTNHDLIRAAASGAPDGAVLVADHQTAGRGRLDRSWHAPPGGSLLVSVLVRPHASAADAHLLTTAMGVSAVEAVAAVTGADARLKWPNDLVVDLGGDGGERFRKLGGILAESTLEGGELDAVVLGLGLNVNWAGDLPDELEEIATSLDRVVGHEVDREQLLVALLTRLDAWYPAALTAGRHELVARARELSATLGRRVRVDVGAEPFEGVAVDLTDDGALVVEVTDAAGATLRREVVAGDVVGVRPS